MSEERQHQRKIASPFKQVLILFWKNGILFKRNIAGTIAEVIMAFLFIVIIFLIRYLIDSALFSDQNSTTNPVLNVLNFTRAYGSRSYIMYYPNNNFIRGIVTSAYNLLNSQMASFTATIIGSDISDATNLNTSIIENLTAFISFPSTYTAALPSQITYTIYTQENASYSYFINSLFYSKTNFLYDNSPQFYCTSNTYFYLYKTLFDPIKYAIDMILIQTVTGQAMTNPAIVKTAQFNCLAYTNDVFKSRFSFFLIILIEFSFAFTLIVNLGNIVVEKEKKIREYLKLSGIKWYIIWLTWILRSLIPYLVLSFLLTLFCCIKLNPKSSDPTAGQKAVFFYTSFTVIFSIFFIYSVQVAIFTLFLAQFFSKAFQAKVITLILWIVTAINFYNNTPTGLKYILAIFPNCGLIFIINVVFQYERGGVSLDYSNLYVNLFGDGVTVGGMLAMMIGWSIIYLPIAWYIEKIFPGEYGAPMPFYFIFMPSYWTNKKNKVNEVEFKNLKNDQNGFETETNQNPTISIQNITKKFRLGFKEKTVVDNMSLNFYENQITGLLGHNGAGKTTTTFMLCGIYAPDEGTAFILGNNINFQMDKIRTSLGFCPQHDILYDDLTVAEHIELVASIKGYTKKEIKEEILKITELVGLENDLEKKSKELSGGMKRRLSVAMSVTGNSKVIILDEPTSGLDPFNRRTLWELIRKFKKGRTIILTTHFMEEADALSDRIAIMNHGQVKCCGSPLYLKDTFGSGYRLAISKNENFKQEAFKSILNSVTEKYVIETNIAAEMSISIPFHTKTDLPKLLKIIDESKSDFGIDGYGISSPTIEEVFIKVGSIDNNKNENEEETDDKFLCDNDNLSNAFGKNSEKNSGFSLAFQQLVGLFIKRFHIFRRRYILALFILLLPFVAEGIFAYIIPSNTNLFNRVSSVIKNYGTNSLVTNNYGSQTLPYYIQTDSSNTAYNLLTNYYSSKSNVNLYSVGSDVNDYVLQKRKSNLNSFIYDYFVGIKLSYISSTLYSTIYFSTLAFHSCGAILNDIANMLLILYSGDSTRSITTTNSPLSPTNSLSNTTSFLSVLACIDSLPLSLLDFLNAIIIAFIISIMVMQIAKERTSGSKQLQLLSGTHYITYWLSNYMFDMIICLINITSMVIILKIVNSAKNDETSEIYAVAGDDTLGYIYLLLIFSCFSWCTLAYIWSFLFKSDIICFVVLFILLAVVAFLDVCLIFFQLFLQTGGSSTSTSSSTTPAASFVIAIRFILALFFPNVTVKRGFYNLKIRQNSFCINAVNTNLNSNYVYNQSAISLSEPGIGLMLIFCVIQFILGNIIIYVLEKEILKNLDFKKFFSKDKVDVSVNQEPEEKIEEDVKKEGNRIKNSDIEKLSIVEPLVVSQLFKKFRKGKESFVAVNNLCFGISPNECFGLLGLNGAGKTTTFKIITGEINATSGKAFINGFDINKDKSNARRNLGFCPQFDCLPEYLNVAETLRLYANLRGVDSKTTQKVIDDLISVFKLNEFRIKLVQKLSGGNKRKVSSAIAFIGKPSVVILDEPTTGMDPAARRYLWTVIKKARDLGMTIVLTTHSMEESEALSTKLGIMVNGQFKCFGSVQHLKSKYGKGYSLILKCKLQENVEEQVTKIEEFVKNKIKFANLKDKQKETLFYQIESNNESNSTNDTSLQSIAELFLLIENNKSELQIETYSLSQTSLEQVFLSFAKYQKEEKNAKDK